MDKKKVMMIIISILVIILIIAVSYNIIKRRPKPSLYNINKEQVVDGIKVTDGMIIQENGLYTYTVNVTNIKEELNYVDHLSFTFYDKDNNKIINLSGYIGRELKPNETIPASASVDKNIKDANRVEIEVKK